MSRNAPTSAVAMHPINTRSAARRRATPAERHAREHHAEPVEREVHERALVGDLQLLLEERRGPAADGDLHTTLEEQHETHQQQHRVAHQPLRGGERKALRLLWARERRRLP